MEKVEEAGVPELLTIAKQMKEKIFQLSNVIKALCEPMNENEEEGTHNMIVQMSSKIQKIAEEKEETIEIAEDKKESEFDQTKKVLEL